MHELENKILADYDVSVPMRDGTILKAVVFRPEREGKWPVLLTRTPYGKEATISYGPSGSMLDIMKSVRNGYIVVIQDCRGRNLSGGGWDPFINLQMEKDDGYDTIEWASKLPYSSGKVGMFGASYVGFVQWMAMLNRNNALKTIIPSVIWDNIYESFIFRSGVLELGLFTSWVLNTQSEALIRTISEPKELEAALSQLWSDSVNLPNHFKDLPICDFHLFRNNHVSDTTLERLNRGYSDQSYLEEILLSDKYNNFDVPALIVAGWYDVFSQGQINNFVGMREKSVSKEAQKSRIIIGPWTHYNFTQYVGDLDFGIQASRDAIDIDGISLRWYDHYLRGEENGIEQDAPVKIFVMGENIWRDEMEWPLARTQYTKYYLHSGNRLGEDIPETENPDQYVYDPKKPAPTIGGCVMIPSCKDGPRDQREIEARDDVISFSTSFLHEDLEITGRIVMNLWASSSAKDTDFVARLVDVYPDGYACLIADGIIRGRFREYSKNKTEGLLEPGLVYLFEIDMWSTSNLFKAGHKIRVDITSSSFPRWDRNPNTGNAFGVDTVEDFIQSSQLVFHQSEFPSYIKLPIIPRKKP